MFICQQQSVNSSILTALNNKNLEEADTKQRVWIYEKGHSAVGKITDWPKGRNTSCCK